MSSVLKEAKRLHDLGFAILWLGKKSKRPVENKWTNTKRKTWSELKASYREGYNVGVLLGEASKLKNGHLACIDVDVKNPKYALKIDREVDKLLDRLMGDPGGINFWQVESGSRNGSKHIYVLTEKPFKMLTIFKEKDQGEICVYSNGRQMVLPPSIHPSGKPYRTTSGKPTFLDVVDFSHVPTFQPENNQDSTTKKPSAFKLSPVELSIDGRLPAKMISLIEDGDDCADRSAGLFKAAIAMVRHGYTDNEIMTVLTEKDTYLGAAAFEHAKTNDRTRAALWIKRYTLDKARTEFDVTNEFESRVGVEDNEIELSEAETKAQADTLVEEGFKTKIERDQYRRPKNTLKNVVTILIGVFGEELFTQNEFSGFQLYGKATPWGAKVGEEIKDSHIAMIIHWFATKWRFEPSPDKVNNAITVIAENNGFHPVREYLDELAWDGVPRLSTWLKRHLSAKAPKDYLEAVSRKVIIAMVARIYEPGKKFDQVLILEGTQGIGKSRAVRALAGDEWFSDAPVDLMNKDGVLSMRATWLMELGELSGMRRSDVDALKEFVSRRVDRIRVPYGKRMENFPRQCVFIGTTNNAEYLRDTTGNRRFWPVSVGECRIEDLASERDQLLAEAKWSYELGEPLWIDDDRALAQAMGEQEKRVETDAWTEKLADFLANPREGFPEDKFTLAELFDIPEGPFGDARMGRSEQLRAATCLRQLGYQKKNARGDNGVVHKYWIKPEIDVGF